MLGESVLIVCSIFGLTSIIKIGEISSTKLFPIYEIEFFIFLPLHTVEISPTIMAIGVLVGVPHPDEVPYKVEVR